MICLRTRKRRRTENGHKNFLNICSTKDINYTGTCVIFIHAHRNIQARTYKCGSVYFTEFNNRSLYIFRPNRNGGPTEAEQLAAASTGELRFSYSLLEKLIHYTDRASINMKLLKPSGTFSRRSSFKICTRDIKFFSKVRF